MMKKVSCFELQLLPLNVILVLVFLPRGTGYSTSPTMSTACSSLPGNIDYNITLSVGEDIDGPRIFYLHGVKIAENNGTYLKPEPSYTSRLAVYGTYGITLSGVTTADAGEYLIVYFVYPAGNLQTSTATFSVIVAPTDSCVPYYVQAPDKATCNLNQDVCGTPKLQTNWTNGLGTSDSVSISSPGNYTCCAYGIAKSCYSGPNSFCKTFTISGLVSTTAVPTISRDLGLGLGISLSLLLIGSIIIFILVKQKVINCSNKNGKEENKENVINDYEAGTASGHANPSRGQSEHRTLPQLSGVPENKQIHPQPLPPGNNVGQDKNFRGLSANYDDAKGLPNDMPLSNRLPPRLAPILQPNVGEETTSVEYQKEKEKKKKK